MVYGVYCRYEYWSNNGKTFNNWFKVGPNFKTEEEANKYIKSQKETSKEIDKHIKLKHEYECRYIDETLLPQIALRRPKGRPKKIDIKYLDELSKKLNRSGKVKVSEEIKCYLYNDNEMKNYINNKIKDNSKYPVYWYNENKELFILLKDKV